jgi:hypothetical protein
MTGRVIQFGTLGILLSAFSCGIVGGNEFGKPVAGRTLFVKVEDLAGRIRLQITNSSNAAVSISPIEIDVTCENGTVNKRGYVLKRISPLQIDFVGGGNWNLESGGLIVNNPSQGEQPTTGTPAMLLQGESVTLSTNIVCDSKTGKAEISIGEKASSGYERFVVTK